MDNTEQRDVAEEKYNRDSLREEWGWDETYGWVDSDDVNEWGQPLGWAYLGDSDDSDM